ncbi:MAG: 3-oxoacyl-ACP reductase FabG [Gammaproteobacteria bacterium]|nr:3-oxoacyl-ACP reductase FabG [Gammaproteobacteria bacterium]
MSEQNRVALVTGATRGIGKAIALELAKKGVSVVGTATSEAGAESITAYFSAAGFNGVGVVLNVTNPDSIQTALTTVEQKFGAPEILVNNAGITRDNLLLRMKDEEWDDVINTNLTAIFRLTKACIRAMVKARWGRIISISSVIGASGNPGQANYAASKAGLIGFNKSLAQEIATRGITANVVAPGYIASDMTAALNDEQKNAILERIPMQQIGQPQDIANAVAFLASDAASYITGVTLHVNGGMIMI